MGKLFPVSALLIYIGLASCQPPTASKNVTANSDSAAASGTEPLPSWNEGPLKRSIMSYVKDITDSSGQHFIPSADRIATFDNDGTLWAERPYMQELFAFYMVKKMVTQNPALARKQPFKAVIDHDKTYFAKNGEKALMELIGATHTGTSEAAFEANAAEFYATGIYPGRNVPFSKIRYQPQLELLNFLRAKGFKTYICTGGTVEFVRAISSSYYGIPKEQVIGTTFKYQFIDSNRTIFRLPAIDHFNDMQGKPVSIQQFIGRPPIFACGNEGGAGDIAMLKFCQSSRYPSFQMIVNHDDSTREFYYQEKDSASLKTAAKNNWHVISMKDDWGKIFSEKP
jgi:haloacid dehalogenase-like hydrolase